MIAFNVWTTFINAEHLMKLYIALIISFQTITDTTSDSTTSVWSTYIFPVNSSYVLYKFSDLFEVLPI